MYDRSQATTNAALANAQPVRESTALEEVLRVLIQHHVTAREIIERLEKMADRLVGAIPQTVGAGQNDSPKGPVELPLVTRLDYAGRDLTSLLVQIHEQINRLDRL